MVPDLIGPYCGCYCLHGECECGPADNGEPLEELPCGLEGGADLQPVMLTHAGRSRLLIKLETAKKKEENSGLA